LLLVFAGIAAIASAQDVAVNENSSKKLIAFRTTVKVLVDENGKPTGTEASGELPDAVRQFVEKRVGSWAFAPPKRDGKVGSGVTFVRLGACAVPVDGGYSLAIDYKGNGPGWPEGLFRRGPKYPMKHAPNVVVQHTGAAFRTTFVVEPDGSITMEEIDWLSRGVSTDERRLFEKSVKDWLTGMQYQPEELDGRKLRTRASVVTAFSMDGSSIPGYGALQDDNLGESNECRLATDGEPGQLPVAQDSPFKLESQG